MTPSNRTKPPHRRRQPEQIEDRVLLDADISDYIAMDGAHESTEAIHRGPRTDIAPEHQSGSSLRLDNGSADKMPRPLARQFVFVDVTADDFETRLGNLQDNGEPLEIVYLDRTRDGITQMAEILAYHSGLDAIHLISHGSEGVLQLGNRTFDRADLALDHASALGLIGAALAPDGDFLLYGCDLAGSNAGQQFIDALARLTGADVAASDHSTENVSHGTEWDLGSPSVFVETHTHWANSSGTEWQGDFEPTPELTTNQASEELVDQSFGIRVAFKNASCRLWEAGFSPYFDLHIPRGVQVNGLSINSGNLTSAREKGSGALLVNWVEST